MAIISVESKVFNNDKGFDIIKAIDDGQAAVAGTAIDVRDVKGINLVVETGTGVSNGTVLLEGAASSAYAGAWDTLGTITTNAASTTFNAGYDNLVAPYPYVRARISTTLTGGTADVYVMTIK